MIKALILDVDGVIVGSKIGFNFPLPNDEVIKTLRSLEDRGIYVSFCTSKPAYVLEKVIKKLKINNIHSAGGGLVIVQTEKHLKSTLCTIPSYVAQKIVAFYKEKDVYLEIDTLSDHIIFSEQKNNITTINERILGKIPLQISDMKDLSKRKIIKIVLIAKSNKEKEFIQNTFTELFSKDLSLTWTIHPVAIPYQFGMIIQKNISKKNGAFAISEATGISLSDTLGIGDTMQDWSFLQECGYAATLSNGEKALKSFLKIKEKEKYYISKYSVNENGLLDILNHFSLKKISED